MSHKSSGLYRKCLGLEFLQLLEMSYILECLHIQEYLRSGVEI